MGLGDASSLLGAALSMRVGVDATGIEAELASKLTGAERVAVTSAERTSASVGRIVDASSSKITAATLRQTAAQESYNRLLRAGETDTVRLARSQAQLITAHRAVANEQRRLTEQEARARAAVDRRGVTPLGVLGGVAAYAAFTTASRTLRTGIEEISEAQAGLAQAEAGIRSTGGAAHVTAPEIEILAHSIQSYSGYTDDAVVAAEDLLLTFPKVRNEVGEGNDMFTRATEAAADLARRGFGDLSTNAKALGKALSDPIAGLTALRRSGITFTEGQREQIKTLVESNRLLDAQRIILDEVNREVGGSAKAYGETLPGQVDRAHRAFEDLSESLITDVEPALSAAAKAATYLGEHDTAVKVGLGAAALGTGFVLAGKAVRLYRDTVDTLFSGGRTAARVSQNAAIAASYDAIAVSAGAAAAAETAAGGAGVVGGAGAVIGRGMAGGLTGGVLGTGLAARGAAALAAPVGLTAGTLLVAPAVGYGAYKGTTAILHAAFGDRFGDDHKPTVELGSKTQALVDQYGSLDAADAALKEQNAAADARIAVPATTPGGVDITKETLQAIRQAGTQYAGGVDIFSRPSTFTGASDARDALGSARTAAATAARRVQLDEQRLSSLRATGKATALQLASAEETLRTAKQRSADASAKVRDAEKAVDEARVPTARSLLKTIGSQERASSRDAESVLQLTGAGLGPNVIGQIVKQDAETPGTLQSIARTITPRLAREIQQSFKQLRSSGRTIEAATGTDAEWRAKARRDATTYTNELNQRLYRQRTRGNRSLTGDMADRRALALSGGVGGL